MEGRGGPSFLKQTGIKWEILFFIRLFVQSPILIRAYIPRPKYQGATNVRLKNDCAGRKYRPMYRVTADIKDAIFFLYPKDANAQNAI